jgi:hypothetical protein
MTDPAFQVITPPPAPRYTVDLFGNGAQGWLPIDSSLYGFQLGEGDPTTYIRPPVRQSLVTASVTA